MSQEKSSDTHPQSVTEKHSWNGVAKLRPQPPKAPQTTPNALLELSEIPDRIQILKPLLDK